MSNTNHIIPQTGPTIDDALAWAVDNMDAERFSTLDDLENKTGVEKESMVPDGNAVDDIMRYVQAIAQEAGYKLGGFVVLESVDDLPVNPTDKTIGYLIDGDLYLWVGEGGDTAEGKYQNCGTIHGTDGQDGAPGPQGPKGDPGTYIDPANVEIFSSPEDLAGKTDAQKESMIPNGLAYEQGGGGDTDALNKSVAVVEMDNNSSTPLNGWIRVSDGSWVSSSTMRTWQITNVNYTRLVAHVRNTDAGAFAISFYRASTISAANRISGTAFSGTDWDDFDVPVPTGTQLICITTRGGYLSTSYFQLFGLRVGEVQSLEDKITNIESGKAIEPFALMYFVGGRGWDNSDQWYNYANLVGDPYKHELSPYLIDGKLVIINNYTGTNQVKCKIPWFNASGGGNSFNAWTVLQQGENVFTPRANSVYFSICLGMNNSGGTEINASDVSMYEGFLFYKLANTNPQQITANIGSIQSIENRLDIMDNFGNPLYVKGISIAYNKTYYGRELKFGKKYMEEVFAIATGGNQAGAIYGDTLFVFKADLKNCFVVDLPSMTIIQNITLTQESNFHCNCATFGVEKADSADEYPLLYVDGLYTKTCYAYRITGARGAYALTKVQTISYPSSLYNPEMVIDADMQTMWIIEEPSHCILRRFAIPTLSQGDVTIDLSNALDTIDIGSVPIIQGASIYNGDLYLATGLTGGGVIFAIDIYTEKNIVTRINYGYEPQTPFIWNNRLHVLGSGEIRRIYNT